MPKSYSADLRERVIEAVEMGASRHEAAERFEVSVSSAVKWLQRWHKGRSAAPKPRGGSVSPLEKCAERILAVIAEHPDRRVQSRGAASPSRRWALPRAASMRGWRRACRDGSRPTKRAPGAELADGPRVLWTAYGRNLTTRCLLSPAG
jgi:transposase